MKLYKLAYWGCMILMVLTIILSIIRKDFINLGINLVLLLMFLTVMEIPNGD